MSHTANAIEKVAVLTYDDESGRPRSSAVSREKANHLVQVGRAYWICETLIVVEYDKKSFRKQVFLRDNYTCVYCGQRPDDAKHLTIDHVLPKSKGGVKSLENCVTACRRCNSWKSNHNVTYFKKTMQFFMQANFTCHYCKIQKVYPQLVLAHTSDGEPIPCCRSCDNLRKQFARTKKLPVNIHREFAIAIH